MAQVNIAIAERNDTYTVRAEFFARAPEDTVRKVLCDYENMPKFVTSVSESKIRERKDGHLVLEQKGKECALFLFSKEIHVLLAVTEEPNRISFEDHLKKDFESYAGSWEFSQTSGGTRSTYSLTAKPHFFVPVFLAKGCFRNEGKRLCEEILAEIQRRML